MQTVTLDPLYELDNVRYMVGDPCALTEDLLAMDCVLAALSMDAMSDPKKFLRSLPRLVKRNGTVVIVTLYNWNRDAKEISSNKEKEGKHVRCEELLKSMMKDMEFSLIHEENIPILKRENERMYRWHVPHATVWRFQTEKSGSPA